MPPNPANPRPRTPSLPRKPRKLSAVLAAGLLALVFHATGGCVLVDEHLTINEDGSGTVEITVTSLEGPGASAAMMPGGDRMPPHLQYPPTNEDAAKRLFPEAAFTSVEIQRQLDEEGRQQLVVTAAFDDVNKFLSTPYARAHSLKLSKDEPGDRLTLAARSGLQVLPARRDALNADGGALPLPVPTGELEESLGQLEQTFRVTLPGAADADSGEADGATVTWSVSAAEHETFDPVAEALSAVRRASCPADAAAFDPVNPPRLDLSDFDSLEEGHFGLSRSDAINNERIREAARITPLALKVTRSFDLAGSGSFYNDGGLLFAAVDLPQELAPQRWGELRIASITDDTGADLRAEDNSGGMSSYGITRPLEQELQTRAQREGRAYQLLEINTAVPDPSARRIRRVEATLPLHYFQAGYVIKVPNALAAGDISEQPRFSFGSNSGDAIDHPKLDELNLSISINGAARNGGMLAIMLSRGEDGAGAISEIQVFDADGNPLPTVTNPMQFGPDTETTRQIAVLGDPESPLSMAMIVQGGADRTELPIELTDLPILPASADDQ